MDMEKRSEKDNAWWKDNVKFVFSHYNTRKEIMLSSRHSRGDSAMQESYVDEMVRMFSYYLGKQTNRDYYYTTTDEDNCELPTVWVNGQKITSLVDYMFGKFLELIQNIEPSTKSLSKAAVNKKTMLIEKLMLKIMAPELFKDMESYGIEYQPAVGGKLPEMNNEEDIYRFMESDYRDQAEIIALRMAEDILNRNHAVEKLAKAALYLLLGGYVAAENRIENGKLVFDIIPPYEAVIDNVTDDDQHRKDRFFGRVNYMSTVDVVARYQSFLTEAEIEEIEHLDGSNYQTGLGFEGPTNWAFSNGNLVQLAVCSVYWVGMKDLKYKQDIDKYGNVHVKKSRTKTENWTKTIYKGTLIGGKYLVDFGECTNIVRSTENFGDVVLPVHVFQPNTVMGVNTSIVYRLHKLQDRIDFLNNEITKMITRAPGKNYLFNKHKLGSSTPQEILNDFKRHGVHVYDGNASGEEYSPEDRDRLVETVDMTIDPNVNLLINLYREQERIMEQIANLPKIATGQQTGYVGAKTQAGTIAQSERGISYLYTGFIQWVEKVLQHALNQYKIPLMVESESEIPVVGTKGKEYLKVTKEFAFEEIGVYLKIRDYIDDESRQRLLVYAQALSQNGLIDPLDMLNIESCKTYSQLYDEFKYSLDRKKREAQASEKEKMAMMGMMQKIQSERQTESQASMEQVRQQGENYRTELKLGAEAAQNLEVPN